MESRVAIRVELVEQGGLEDRIGGVHRLEEVIASGAPENPDRGHAAGDAGFHQFTEDAHGGE